MKVASKFPRGKQQHPRSSCRSRGAVVAKRRASGCRRRDPKRKISWPFPARPEKREKRAVADLVAGSRKRGTLQRRVPLQSDASCEKRKNPLTGDRLDSSGPRALSNPPPLLLLLLLLLLPLLLLLIPIHVNSPGHGFTAAAVIELAGPRRLSLPA